MPEKKRHLKIIILLLSLVLGSGLAHADRILLRGIVRDSLTTEGIPYASVTPADGGATVADSRGIFELLVPEGCEYMVASSQGYRSKKVRIERTSHNLYDINLSPEAQELKEVVVKKKKYSKRNNPAVDFARMLRDKAGETDPRRNDYYSFDRYERVALGLNDFDTTTSNALMRRFPWLVEHVDTSEISGRPVLNVSVKERLARELYRRNPEAEKTIVSGIRSRGVDEFMDMENVQTVLDDLLREVDLYDNDIRLLRNNFVSPLSPVAPDFYRFYLVDTVDVGGEKCVDLAFYPRNKASVGFTGHVYVPAEDSTMFIKRVEMRVPREINLNFIDAMTITQNFDRAADGSRLKTDDELLMELSVVKGTPSVYASRKLTMSNHSFEPPADGIYFAAASNTIELDSAATRDDAFWEAGRLHPERTGESRIGQLMTRIRQTPGLYWTEKILRVLFNGYIATGKRSKFDFGPVNTFASYNTLEGLRLRVGGITTANLSPHWFGRGYVAYGFRDKKWKYSAEVEYSINRKKYHSREFPVHSLRLTHSYDVDRLGAHYLFTNSDNFVLSLQRMPNNRYTYRRLTKLEYTLELACNFSTVVSVANIRQEASPFVKFEDAAGRVFGHYTENVAGIDLRWAPGERFLQGRTNRYEVNRDAPVITLSHRYAPKGFAGSKFGINKTELTMSKRFWLSFMGSADVAVAAGHVWGATAFPELMIPNVNLSYIIQPRTFDLMNPMEFINSSYVSWFIEYRMRGLIFNQIPWVKKLGLREVVGFRGIYGHLAEKCVPTPENGLLLFPADAHTRPMDQGPYMEISAGLDNILRCLRLDYVWRLSYRHVPYEIDRHGLRVALHFTF